MKLPPIPVSASKGFLSKFKDSNITLQFGGTLTFMKILGDLEPMANNVAVGSSDWVQTFEARGANRLTKMQ